MFINVSQMIISVFTFYSEINISCLFSINGFNALKEHIKQLITDVKKPNSPVPH